MVVIVLFFQSSRLKTLHYFKEQAARAYDFLDPVIFSCEIEPVYGRKINEGSARVKLHSEHFLFKTKHASAV